MPSTRRRGSGRLGRRPPADPLEPLGRSVTRVEAAGNETDADTAEDGHFLADIDDPVFGYSLADGEADDLNIQYVVDVAAGSDAHENFPREPDDDDPEELTEVRSEFFFDPVGLHVEPEDLVHFDAVAGLHTVTASHEKFTEPGIDMPTRVPGGVPGYTSPPLIPGESWVYQFTEKAVYDYSCFRHLGSGMVGRIVVFDPEEDAVESDEFAAPTEGDLFPNVERVLAAEELESENIVEAGSVAWADLTLSAQQTPTEIPAETETPTETETPGNETDTPTDAENGTGSGTPTPTEFGDE